MSACLEVNYGLMVIDQETEHSVTLAPLAVKCHVLTHRTSTSSIQLVSKNVTSNNLLLLGYCYVIAVY
jgi:hypothetical protein